MSESVEDRDVEDGPVLAHERVGQDGPEDWGEVADGREGMVQNSRQILVVVEHLLEEEREDGCKTKPSFQQAIFRPRGIAQ